MKWFRLYSEARNDAKLRALDNDQFRVWFNLLCFAAEQSEQRGTICGFDCDLLAVEVADADTELLNTTLERLEKLRMICIDENDCIHFLNFEKRQYDKPSDTPEATRERKRLSRQRHADVTPSHATEEEVEEDTESDTELTTTSTAHARETAQILVEASFVDDDLDSVSESVGRAFRLRPEFPVRDGPLLAEKFVRWRGYTKKPPKDWYSAWLNWLKKEIGNERPTQNGRHYAHQGTTGGVYGTGYDDAEHGSYVRERIDED